MVSKAKKICIDARLLTGSGIGRYISEILPSLSLQFDVICLVEKSGIKLIEEFEIPYIICDAGIYSIKEQLLLPRIIPPCDLFWSPHFNVPLLPIKAQKRLVTIHDAYHLAFQNQLTLAERFYAKLVFKMAMILSDAVITVSNFSKSELTKYLGFRFKDKIKVILNGVTRLNLPIKQKVSESHNYFLFVGNVKPHKNLKNAILGFKKFCQNNPESSFRFKIVGKKNGFINADLEIEKLCMSDPIISQRIDFTGFVDDSDLGELYKNAYCLIFPSLYEGFGLPPLEAMMLGTPALVAHAASMPELCLDAVLYFNPIDNDDICAAMENIVADKELYNNLKTVGMERAREFNWSVSATSHVNLIRQILYQNTI